MDKKTKTAGLLLTGAVLLNVNTAIVNAEEQNTTDEGSKAQENTSKTSTLKTSESKNLPVESETKSDNKISFDGKYDTLEEAEKRKAEKEAEYRNNGYEDIKSEIITIKDTKGTEVFDHFDIEVTIDAYTDLSEEEANELKSELEQDENVTATIKEAGEVYDHDEVTDFSEKFKDDEDAAAIIKAMKDEGYTVSDLNYVYDTDTEEVTLNETFEELKDAEDAANEFKNTYEVTEEPVITKVEDSTEDVTETYSKDFDDATKADEYKASEEAKTTEDVIYTAEKTETPGETEELNETFDTREKAEAAIAEFEASHAVLDSESNIEEKEAGTIYSGIVITKDMKTYEVGSTTYVIIKHGNEHVIWTEKELTSEEQDTFIESYKEHEDNVITYRKLKQKHTFTSGYGESNYSGNGKMFTFYEEDGKTYIKMESGAESRVIAGEYQPINEYVATASGHNITYTVNVTKITKGYDYNVTAKGTKEVALASGTVTGKKSKPVNRKVYSIDVSTKKEVYKTVYNDDYNLKINAVKKEVINNPKTSDNIAFSIITMLTSTFGLAANSLKRFKKEN